MLVLLRISIGWHFLAQGMGKFQNPNFSSEGYLTQAKGPLAERYFELIPDFYGHQRLNADRVLEAWQDYQNRFVEAYRLSDEQRSLAEVVAKRRRRQLSDYFDEQQEDIDTYFHELERLNAWKSAPGADDMPYQQKRIREKHDELHRQAMGWIRQVEQYADSYRNDLVGILDADQRRRGSPPAQATSLDRMDAVTKYTNVAIGVCLIVGLLTRLAAFGGAAFLLLLIGAQPSWPGIYPPDPPSAGTSLIVNKEFIEMVALLALAALPVGRWGGLDFFVHHLVTRPFLDRRGT